MSLKISGAFACFTRPELKAERVSYEVMTPSAARGILEAILWKPAMCWQVRSIAVLKPIRWHSIHRNELRGMPSMRDITSRPLWIEDDRIQRNSLILKDVAYRIDAELSLSPQAGPDERLEKFVAMFERRLRRGQCFAQPYLGCREFSASFEAISSEDEPIALSRDLGWMLHDMDYAQRSPEPRFFRASLEKGVLRMPDLLELAV